MATSRASCIFAARASSSAAVGSEPSGTKPAAGDGEGPIDGSGADDPGAADWAGGEDGVPPDGSAGEQPATRRIARPIANDRAGRDLSSLVIGSLFRALDTSRGLARGERDSFRIRRQGRASVRRGASTKAWTPSLGYGDRDASVPASAASSTGSRPAKKSVEDSASGMSGAISGRSSPVRPQ